MKRGRRACANLKFEFVQKTRYTPFSVTLHNDVTRKSMLGLYSPHIELVVRKEDSTSNRRLSSLNFNLSLSLSLSPRVRAAQARCATGARGAALRDWGALIASSGGPPFAHDTGNLFY